MSMSCCFKAVCCALFGWVSACLTASALEETGFLVLILLARSFRVVVLEPLSMIGGRTRAREITMI